MDMIEKPKALHCLKCPRKGSGIKKNANICQHNAYLRQTKTHKEAAYRSGDRIQYNKTRNTLTKKIRTAKDSIQRSWGEGKIFS